MEIFFKILGEMSLVLFLLILASIAIPFIVSSIFKSKIKVCDCGQKLEPGVNYCPKCGRKVK